ncbi:MAG: DUF3822 family protein [Bacteroidetes bacterium]|nr:DUF3822 family protein [Bacteroidota bacterium]
MQETGNKSILKHAILNESFDGLKPEGYDLFLYVGPESFSCLVADRSRKEFIALESWSIAGSEIGEIPDLLISIRSTSSIIQNNRFRRIICCSGFRAAALVPNALFEPSSAIEQLQFLVPVGTENEILSDEMRQLEARHLFAIPTGIYELITSWFPTVEFHHTGTAMIEYLLSKYKNHHEPLLHINAGDRMAEIIVNKGKNLLFYNSFEIHTPEEFVYYILFVCEQLHLNPETLKVTFSGNMELTDAAYMLTTKYIRHTGLNDRPDNYSFAEEFDQILPHQYFHIFSQLVCAS